jgi:hypothetical protein
MSNGVNRKRESVCLRLISAVSEFSNGNGLWVREAGAATITHRVRLFAVGKLTSGI